VVPIDITSVDAHAAATDSDAPLDVDASHAAWQRRAQRRSQVRERVEEILGISLQEAGPDYVLPDNRLVAIYYSKIHSNGNVFLGIKKHIKNDSIIVLLLGDETHPEHLVFPRAETLLLHRESFAAVGNDRLVPPIRVSNGKFALWRPSKGLTIPLDDRIDAYHELLDPPEQKRGRPNPIGRNFVEDDENVVPCAATSGLPDPGLVGRGNRAYKHIRNALATHLKSLGIQPLDPTLFDPPFDLAWWQGKILYVAEVKSTTRENEEHQLRLGLGQLLRYCHILRKRVEHVVPVLAPELKPRDPEWGQLCRKLNIRLVFPPDFEALTG
jgi:hypothetical protein